MTQNLPHLNAEIKNQNQLWITLNHPEKMNAISYEMIDSLTATLFKAEMNPDVKVIVIRGADKAFSAGGDVQAMKDKSGMFQGDSNELRMRYMQGIQKIPKCMEDLSKPIIAMVNGAAVGAGCDLAMMCDLRIGCEESRFGETFAKLGLVPGDGGTFFLTRVVGFSKAMQMTMTAEIITGKKAFDFGLMNYFVETADLEKETTALATKIASLPSVAVQMAKKALKAAYRHDLQVNLDLLAAFQGIAQRTPDHEKAVNAFFDKK
ncbi:3-hxdroxyacyl-CoA dehydrogenase [Bdellovibrio sp. qaytius]|nr:3-hxdroxyacyl-CoA dehydrogenase [Bdellovibrio sp. qaytius]